MLDHDQNQRLIAEKFRPCIAALIRLSRSTHTGVAEMSMYPLAALIKVLTSEEIAQINLDLFIACIALLKQNGVDQRLQNACDTAMQILGIDSPIPVVSSVIDAINTIQQMAFNHPQNRKALIDKNKHKELVALLHQPGQDLAIVQHALNALINLAADPVHEDFCRDKLFAAGLMPAVLLYISHADKQVSANAIGLLNRLTTSDLWANAVAQENVIGPLFRRISDADRVEVLSDAIQAIANIATTYQGAIEISKQGDPLFQLIEHENECVGMYAWMALSNLYFSRSVPPGLLPKSLDKVPVDTALKSFRKFKQHLSEERLKLSCIKAALIGQESRFNQKDVELREEICKTYLEDKKVVDLERQLQPIESVCLVPGCADIASPSSWILSWMVEGEYAELIKKRDEVESLRQQLIAHQELLSALRHNLSEHRMLGEQIHKLGQHKAKASGPCQARAPQSATLPHKDK